jgi:hypothetical protein
MVVRAGGFATWWSLRARGERQPNLLTRMRMELGHNPPLY